MPAPVAPVARTNPGNAQPANRSSAAQVASVPFPVASLRRTRQAFDTGNLSLGQNVSAIELPAAGGFLRWLELVVTGTTTANVAAVAFQPDAPFNVLQFIEFLPPSGDPPIVPHTGYQIMLWNKYGFFSQTPPYCDPRRDTGFVAVAGTGATGGSFAYTLRLPFEIDPQSGYCSITNSAANKSYLLNFIVNTAAAVYTVAPTTAPVIRIVGWMYYWDEPMGNTRQGSNQETGPIGLGSFSQLRIDTPPLTPGDKYIKVNNAGPLLRQLLLVLRTSTSQRVTTLTDMPAMWDFVFNTRDRFLLSDGQLLSDMSEATGYQAGTGPGGFGTAPAFDTAGGLDMGVRFFPGFNDFGGIAPTNPRSQYQVTADATLTQIRGISFGASVASAEVLTNLIRPRDAVSLYPAGRI